MSERMISWNALAFYMQRGIGITAVNSEAWAVQHRTAFQRLVDQLVADHVLPQTEADAWATVELPRGGTEVSVSRLLSAIESIVLEVVSQELVAPPVERGMRQPTPEEGRRMATNAREHAWYYPYQGLLCKLSESFNDAHQFILGCDDVNAFYALCGRTGLSSWHAES